MMKRLAIALAVITAATTALVAQAKPNLSWSWSINREKSNFGLLGEPPCDKLRLTHEEPVFTLEEASSGGASCGLKIRYTTGGEIVQYQVGGVTMRGRAFWRETALVTQRLGADGVATGDRDNNLRGWPGPGPRHPRRNCPRFDRLEHVFDRDK
jgi:hypothetical protein